MWDYVAVVYHVTIVASGHELKKKFWPFGNRLHSTHCREFIYVKLKRTVKYFFTFREVEMSEGFKNNDCYFYYNSVCAKGKECQFRYCI